MDSEPYLVWLANKPWDDFGIDQRITREMTRYGHLLWVDPPVSLATSTERRFGAPRTVRPILSVMGHRITRLTPTALPGMTRPGIHVSTAPLLRAQVRWALRQTGTRPSAVVATSLEDVLGRWGKDVVNVLHGTDDYVAGAELMGLSARRLRAQEKRAVTKADIVTALSPLLAERWSKLRGGPVPLIPNGCSPTIASAQRLATFKTALPRPVVGLVGRLNARIDITLLEAIVEAGYSLLIVGPHNPSWEPRRFLALTARPQVHHVGRVPEESVPDYVAASDIGITPYMDNDFNRASFPLKTLDYLSVGRPVVSTALPAARWLLDDLANSDQRNCANPIMLLADDRSTFVSAVRSIVGDPGEPAPALIGSLDKSPIPAERCRAFAARHTWARRADTLAAIIGLSPSD